MAARPRLQLLGIYRVSLLPAVDLTTSFPKSLMASNMLTSSRTRAPNPNALKFVGVSERHERAVVKRLRRRRERTASNDGVSQLCSKAMCSLDDGWLQPETGGSGGEGGRCKALTSE